MNKGPFMVAERLIDWTNTVLYGYPYKPAYLSMMNWFIYKDARVIISVDDLRMFNSMDGRRLLSNTKPYTTKRLYGRNFRQYLSRTKDLAPNSKAIMDILYGSTVKPTAILTHWNMEEHQKEYGPYTMTMRLITERTYARTIRSNKSSNKRQREKKAAWSQEEHDAVNKRERGRKRRHKARNVIVG